MIYLFTPSLSLSSFWIIGTLWATARAQEGDMFPGKVRRSNEQIIFNAAVCFNWETDRFPLRGLQRKQKALKNERE